MDAHSEARDLLWTFDAVGRLAEAQVLGAAGGMRVDELRRDLTETRFVTPGALWWALAWESALSQLKQVSPGAKPPTVPTGGEGEGCVVLIDEVDKADASVPNGLLEALGSARFDVPGIAEGIGRSDEANPPLVIVTTNEERALPDAFLRRCMVLQLSLPTAADALVEWLVDRGSAHFPECDQRLLHDAARLTVEDRESVRRRGLAPPGQAEYLDLVRALLARHPEDADKQRQLLDAIAKFALDKHPVDPNLEPDRR